MLGVGAGNGASALLDQHLPDLGSGASVPRGLPQWEINTLRGNCNWIRARAPSHPVLGDDLPKLWPLIYDGQSDTVSFDNCLSCSPLSGYSLAPRGHADDPRGLGGQRADG